MSEEGFIFVAPHFDQHAISYRGRIDTIHRAAGIEGWALDLASPTERVRLQCAVDFEILAECETDRPREDVRQLARCHGSAGFRIPPDVFDAAARLLGTHGERKLAVKIAGTNLHLPFAGSLPTVRELVTPAAAVRSAPMTRPAAPPPALRRDASAPEAATLLAYPLRAVSENLVGRIELTSIDVAGEIWISGWMKKGHPVSFAAVLHDGQKHLARVELVGYERGDLPGDALAVFGVIRSPWRPTAETGDLFLFFGDEGRFHLRWNKPIQFRSMDELLRLFEEVKSRCYAGSPMDMLRALSSLSNWSPRLSQITGFAADAHVDRMLTIPYFGVFIEGWVLSPVKTVDQLSLRIGGTVLPLDPASTYRKRRADLSESFQGPDEFLDRRGIVACFRGEIPPDIASDPILKVVFTDGTAINHAIDHRVVRRLAHSATLQDVLAYYPSIQSEPFFDDFATAAGRAVRERMARHRAYRVAAARRVLVMSLPHTRADLYLLFDALSRYMGRKWQPPGLAFVIGDNERRVDAIPLFEELANACDCRCSLLLVPNIDYALYALPGILKAIGAARFVYYGPDVFPSDAGWRAAVRFLSQDDTGLLYFGLDGEPDGAAGATRSADCFGWTTGEFEAWVEQSPALVGGFDAGILMPWTGARSRLRRGGAWRTRERALDRLAQLVNQQVLRHGGIEAKDHP